MENTTAGSPHAISSQRELAYSEILEIFAETKRLAHEARERGGADENEQAGDDS